MNSVSDSVPSRHNHSSSRSETSEAAEDALFAALDVLPHVEKEQLKKERDGIMGKVGLLAELHPDTFQRTYKFRFWQYELYPLAVLCAFKAPQELIEAVYDLCPKAASDAFRVQSRYAKDTRVLRWLYNKKPTLVKRESGPSKNLPLHDVCMSNIVDVVKFVYEAYPDALLRENKNGHTPFYFAFQCSTLSIIEYMIEQSDAETALFYPNANGFTPLHAAFINKRQEVSEFVAESYPDFLKKASPRLGWFPLHFACACAKSTVGIKVLLEHYPDAAKLVDNKGRLPLALALKNENIKEDHDLIELVALFHPDTPMDAIDENGDLAVDLLERQGTF
mmetsp:Transcript_18252/g.30281  ORF Transcript_18252/g.30281 Transcript_18252/m.30281 type:complete len:335 (-) Transcript_18252:666-1670(-)